MIIISKVNRRYNMLFLNNPGQINGYLTQLEQRQNPMVDAWDSRVNGIGFSP